MGPSKNLLQRLAERRWQMTPQRRVIAEVLAGEHVHLTADEILDRAVERLPEISRATAYKTLNELVALGEVASINVGGRARRYDPNVGVSHQHLVCEGCGMIRDIHPDGQDALSLSSSGRFGFTLTGIDVVFRGLCPDCAKKKS
jgi:Fur family transcriptional regulator, stress-responsive regulator